MTESDVFIILDALNIPDELLQRYMAQRAITIPTPCPIVYLKDGKFTIYPYLDLRQKHNIWGIQSAGLLWKKEMEKSGTWPEAMTLAAACLINKKAAILPNVDDFSRAYAEAAQFNETVRILQQNFIKADMWQPVWFWTQTLYNKSHAKLYGMFTNCDTIDEQTTSAHIRIAFKL